MTRRRRSKHSVEAKYADGYDGTRETLVPTGEPPFVASELKRALYTTEYLNSLDPEVARLAMSQASQDKAKQRREEHVTVSIDQLPRSGAQPFVRTLHHPLPQDTPPDQAKVRPTRILQRRDTLEIGGSWDLDPANVLGLNDADPDKRELAKALLALTIGQKVEAELDTEQEHTFWSRYMQIGRRLTLVEAAEVLRTNRTNAAAIQRHVLGVLERVRDEHANEVGIVLPDTSRSPLDVAHYERIPSNMNRRA